MEAAFVVVANRGAPSPMGPATGELERALTFAVADRVVWSSNDGRISAHAWHAPCAAWPGPSWATSDVAIALLAGHAHWVGREWSAPAAWCRQLLGRSPEMHVPELWEQARGLFGAVVISADGSGWIASDPLALRCVYIAEDERVLVAASTAALAAHAFASHGGRTDRSARDVAWMALTTYHVGARTGYRGVKVLPPGAFVRFQHGSPTVVQTHLTEPTPTDRHPSLDELAERARADIWSTLEAARSHPSPRHVIRLTGGKDSRLVLAVAVWAGAAGSWQYETIGPPRLADVQVATELATELGLEHDVRFVGLAPSTPYADRARQFVARTAGMVNVWDLDNPNESDAVVVTGICGEILRSIVRADPPPRSQQDVLDLFSLKRLGRSRLVLPEVLADLHRELEQDLLEPTTNSTDPLYVLHAHYHRNRLRFSRVGPREELPGPTRIQPLYGLTAIRSAFTLPAADRQDEVLVRRIIEMSAPSLASHRFAGPSWPTNAQPTNAQPTTTTPAPAPTPTAKSLMATLHGDLPDDRREVLDGLISDQTNPAWDVLDRSAAANALDRYSELSNRQRRELFGAATAALWLDPHMTPGPGGG